jgi:hypothetical protein
MDVRAAPGIWNGFDRKKLIAPVEIRRCRPVALEILITRLVGSAILDIMDLSA